MEKQKRENRTKQQTKTSFPSGAYLRFSLPRLVGSRHFLSQIDSIVEKIKNSKSTLLIGGETGVGKSLLAKYMFLNSQVYKASLRILSLSEIPENLFESQLFGHRKGSFTGALDDFEGKFRATEKGTVILEDIACLPLHLQAKLLRVIEEKEFERIGETTPISVDIRIIATTNTPLDKLVGEGKFRKDLYYRLNVLPVEILPLRQRIEDIEPLALHFLQLISREQKKNLSKISKHAMNVLIEYGWPGNVRELRSAIEQAVCLGEAKLDSLEPKNLPPTIRLYQKNAHLEPETLGEELKELERKKIIETLIRNKGHKGRTAQELGISRRTLYYKMEELRIKFTSG